jgi:hypothetical protein
MRRDATWDGTFGGEVGLIKVCERAPLSALGVVVGGLRLAKRERGHVWLELVVGTASHLPAPVGIATGPLLEIDEVRPARPGWQASLWMFVGVTPYIRTGWVHDSGAVIEAGIKLQLPALRW